MADAPADRKRRAWWLKQLHTWHWVSSAACLAGLLLFAITGITLNHARSIESTASTEHRSATLGAAALASLQSTGGRGALPEAVAREIRRAIGVKVSSIAPEWSDDEAYVALPRPGGDAWLTVGRADGAITYEATDRGWVAWANDLHKGRNAGTAWAVFLDAFAVACLVFAISGLLLLKLHAARRAATWPMVGFGLLLPLLIVLFLIH
jgi:uncharacterized protein